MGLQPLMRLLHELPEDLRLTDTCKDDRCRPAYDGRRALQMASTVFTPADPIGVR